MQDGDLRLYKEKKARRRLFGRLFIIGLAGVLALTMFLLLAKFYFVVQEITIEGSSRYTEEELLEASGISIKDNMFSLSEADVEETLKLKFPYIKNVTLEKDYPDRVKLIVTEEYTTFSYEMLGEYYLFNHALRVMEKFDTYEELIAVRKPISVKMPLPKSCIAPQYIQLEEGDEYVFSMIETISQSQLINDVTEIDLSDKFVIRLIVNDAITVEFGDYTMAQEKLISLYRLIGSQEEKMKGNVDLSDYPNCFYALTPKSDP